MPRAWSGRTPRARAAAARAKAMYMKKAIAANIIKKAVAKYGRRPKGQFTIPARRPYFTPYGRFYLAGLRRRRTSYRRRR